MKTTLAFLTLMLSLITQLACASSAGEQSSPESAQALNRWKADPVLLRQCVEKKPPRHEIPDHSKLYKPGRDPWPSTLQGQGNLNLVIQATQRQIEACEKNRKALTRNAKIGTCTLQVADWCDRTAKDIQATARRLLNESKGQTPEEVYQAFLNEVKAKYDFVTLLGPEADSQGRPVDREANTLLTAYYSPTLEASRTKTAEFRYPIFSPPPGIRRVNLGNGKSGWRIPKKGGGWERPPARSVVEAEDGRFTGKVIAYLNDPLDRYKFYIEGAGTLNFRDQQGKLTQRRAQYKADNSYPNYMLAKIVRCELEQRGPPYTELKDGKWVVKSDYIKGDGFRRYLRDNEQPIWSKFHELVRETESIIFFEEGPRKEAGGIYSILLTADVSLATDQRLVPFGFPVVITEDGQSFLGFSQDTGGVIKGAQFDIFVGEGERAKQIANTKAAFGTSRVLVPKGCHQ